MKFRGHTPGRLESLDDSVSVLLIQVVASLTMPARGRGRGETMGFLVPGRRGG